MRGAVALNNFQSDVILNDGEAGVKDLTTARRFDGAEGNPTVYAPVAFLLAVVKMPNVVRSLGALAPSSG